MAVTGFVDYSGVPGISPPRGQIPRDLALGPP